MAALEADGVGLNRSQVLLDAPIKTIGQHKITIAVHPEVEVHVSTTVARSEAEAERIRQDLIRDAYKAEMDKLKAAHKIEVLPPPPPPAAAPAAPAQPAQ